MAKNATTTGNKKNFIVHQLPPTAGMDGPGSGEFRPAWGSWFTSIEIVIGINYQL